jgi:hypothetical protein
MKLQDKHPFDSAIVGLNGTYTTVGEDSFFVNSPCIIAKDQIITRGLNYQLYDSPIGYTGEHNEVKLLDVFYRDSSVNLIVQEPLSGMKYSVSQCLECEEVPCHWILVDISYLLNQWKGSGNAIK